MTYEIRVFALPASKATKRGSMINNPVIKAGEKSVFGSQIREYGGQERLIWPAHTS
jgi:hypothetical protein